RRAGRDVLPVLVEHRPGGPVVVHPGGVVVVDPAGTVGRAPVRRLPDERAGLAGGVGVVHTGPVGCGVGRRGVVYQHRRAGRGPGVYVEHGPTRHGGPVLVEDGPPVAVVEHPDGVVVVHLARAVVRGHHDDRVGVPVDDRVVQDRVAAEDV